MDPVEHTWQNRLLEIANLKRGWLDGLGEEVGPSVIEYAREIMCQLNKLGIARPGIFPMQDGGIQIEWQDSKQLVSVEIYAYLNILVYQFDLYDGSETTKETTNLSEAVNVIVGMLS